MDTPQVPLPDYMKSSCPFCQADLPHARHLTALDAQKMDIRIVDVPEGDVALVFEGTHAIERKDTPALVA